MHFKWAHVYKMLSLMPADGGYRRNYFTTTPTNRSHVPIDHSRLGIKLSQTIPTLRCSLTHLVLETHCSPAGVLSG